MTIVLNYSIAGTQKVSQAMFGGNVLFKFNPLATSSPYDQAAQLLGLTGLRYPGGTMTETDFDVTHPDAPPPSSTPGKPYVGITDFLNYAAQTGRAATVVLPTSKMYLGTADPNSATPRQIDQSYLDDVLAYVKTLITHGDSGPGSLPDTPIAAFELGNEYWGSGKMTAKEYGQVANALAAGIERIFDTVLGPNAPHPQVLVQMGGPWDAQFKTGIYSHLAWADRVYRANQDIIDQITNPDAKSAITGILEHYYYTDTDRAFTYDSQALTYINADVKQWAAAGYADRDLFLTEWNIQSANAAQYGLVGASTVIEMMEYMVDLGTDAAFVWPVQGWETSLAGSNSATPSLTPTGAAFKLMSESLVGTTLLSSGSQGGSIEVNSYASADKAVFYVMSRSDGSQIVDLDVSKIVSDYAALTGTKIGVGVGVDVHTPGAKAVLTTYAADQLGGGTILHFTLNAYEVMEIEFTLKSSNNFFGTAASERFWGGTGNDNLNGAGGNDSLVGRLGSDLIDGSTGRDLLSGWGGNDRMFGGDDIDMVYGQQGDDVLSGGIGNDCLYGGTDNDMLWGQEGADKLEGGSGDDSLWGGSALDTLSGGDGRDQFIFSTTSYTLTNTDRITDFQTGIDSIVLTQTIFAIAAKGRLADAAFTANASGLATDLSDRIIYETDSGMLWYDRDGSATGFARVAFASMPLGQVPHASDFLVI